MQTSDARLLQDLLIDAADRRPGSVAVASARSRMTYGELVDTAARLGSGLRQVGVRPGDRVAIAMANDVPAVAATLGVLFAGGAFVLVHPEATPHTLDAVLRISGASTIVTEASMAATVDGVAERIPSLRTVVARGSVGPGAVDLDELLTSADASPPRSATADDLASLVFTSGTSGEPKGAMMKHANLVFLAGSIASSLGLRQDDRVMSVLSLAHSYGLSWLVASLDRGASLFLERSFAYPGIVRERVAAEGVTVFPGVPTVFAMLLALHRRSPIAFPLVRTVTCAGGALLPAFLPGMREIFPNAGIHHMYGQTECMRISVLPPERLGDRPTSCGTPIPGTEAFVLSPEGLRVGPGEVGVLHVRGPHVTPGYFGDPHRTAEILVPTVDGPMLRTHDLFRTDEEGLLYFLGRGDEIVKTRGEKVSPVEVENALHAIAGIREAAVVGVPDELLGETVRAFVVLDPGSSLDAAAIVAACHGSLEHYKIPRDVVILERLPKTATGKILKRNLAGHR